MINIITSPIAAGSVIEFWVQQSPLGQIVVAQSSHGICYLGLGDCFDDLRSRFVGCRFEQTARSIELSQIETLHLRCTEFQLSVWRALLAIPRGAVVSYADIARAIGRPRSVRAVGTAIGSNPVSLVVPCHRVIRSDGGLGGYYWGLDLKRALLAQEVATAFAVI